jgi:hypothetical protein
MVNDLYGGSSDEDAEWHKVLRRQGPGHPESFSLYSSIHLKSCYSLTFFLLWIWVSAGRAKMTDLKKKKLTIR